MSGDKVIVSNIGAVLDDDECRKEKIFPSTGGNPYTILISESGL